jgi:delta8-fatty-acid desaturase
MSKYRIGRIDMPWLNFTPPIRGGLFRQLGDDDETTSAASSEDDDEDVDVDEDLIRASANSSTTSVDTVQSSFLAPTSTPTPTQRPGEGGKSIYPTKPNPIDQLRRPFTAPVDFDPCKHGLSSTLTPTHRRIVKPETHHQSPDGYVTAAVQKEIDDNVNGYPSLDATTQRNITRKYQALHERVKNEGFYDCRYREYAQEAARYAALFSVFLVALRSGWYMTAAAFLGFFWVRPSNPSPIRSDPSNTQQHQIMFTAHDAGHRGITHNFVADTLIGVFIADFCCGLSIGWWKSSHNVHHLITNHPEHDPDIQNIPLFATSPSFLRTLHSSYYNFTYIFDKFAALAVPYQAYTYYPIMGIARFNLYILSWGHLLSRRSTNLGSASWTRPVEIAFMCCYWFLFGYCLLWRSIPTWTLRVAFVLVSHIITMPLHVQITLSHWGMPTADLGDAESFPQRQLRTTMDVSCPAWFDFVHGGLQFQAVHHLFPRVPRHNLRRLQVLVREFCEETGIEYKILGFVEGNKDVLGRLGEVGRQVEMLVKCQKHMAETGESGLH